MENRFAHKLTAHFQDFLQALYCVERLQLDGVTYSLPQGAQ